MIKINSTLSLDKHILNGVSQSTALSLLLFKIQINDINSQFLIGNLICFADDTSFIVSGDFWHEVFQKIQEHMKSLYQWLLENNMFPNIEKTFILPK